MFFFNRYDPSKESKPKRSFNPLCEACSFSTPIFHRCLRRHPVVSILSARHGLFQQPPLFVGGPVWRSFNPLCEAWPFSTSKVSWLWLKKPSFNPLCEAWPFSTYVSNLKFEVPETVSILSARHGLFQLPVPQHFSAQGVK